MRLINPSVHCNVYYQLLAIGLLALCMRAARLVQIVVDPGLLQTTRSYLPARADDDV